MPLPLEADINNKTLQQYPEAPVLARNLCTIIPRPQARLHPLVQSSKKEENENTRRTVRCTSPEAAAGKQSTPSTKEKLEEQSYATWVPKKLARPKQLADPAFDSNSSDSRCFLCMNQLIYSKPDQQNMNLLDSLSP